MKDSYLDAWREFVTEQAKKAEREAPRLQGAGDQFPGAAWNQAPELNHNAKINVIAALIDQLGQYLLQNQENWPYDWTRYGAEIATPAFIISILQDTTWTTQEVIEAAKEAGYVVKPGTNIIKFRKPQ